MTTTWYSWTDRFADGGLTGVQTQLHRTDQATTVQRAFETRLIPGILQTSAYAHAVFTKINAVRGITGEVSAAVTARLKRRAYLSDPHRKFEFLVAESALTEPIHGYAVQIEQLEHLLQAIAAPNIHFGILPADRPLSVVAEHAFTLYDGQGVIEGHLGELHVSGNEAAFLNHVMDALWRDAIVGNDVHQRLMLMCERLR